MRLPTSSSVPLVVALVLLSTAPALRAQSQFGPTPVAPSPATQPGGSGAANPSPGATSPAVVGANGTGAAVGATFDPGATQPPTHPLIRQNPAPAPIAKHDLILVVVQEQTRADVNTQLLANRETEAALELDEFVRFRGLDLRADRGPQPNIDVSGSIETQALGRTNRNEVLQLRITARVIDVLDNGNVRIEGRRERRINDETTVVKLSGEIPRGAIARDMSITSDRIADLKIEYSGDGPVSRRTGDTWWAKVADFIWPF